MKQCNFLYPFYILRAESFHFAVLRIIRSSNSRTRTIFRDLQPRALRENKRKIVFTVACKGSVQRSANSHKHIDVRGMRRIWIFWIHLERREGRCALRDSQLGNGGYSFSDTTNFTTAGRSDKNAKRSGKMRCSLPSSSFFLLSACSHLSLAPLHFTRCMIKTRTKLRTRVGNMQKSFTMGPEKTWDSFKLPSNAKA